MARKTSKVPIPEDKDLPKAKGEVDPKHRSPLGMYLKLNNVSVSAFAKAIGCPYRTVAQWVDGGTLPPYPAIYEIERLTKGLVPPEAWMGMPQAKKMIAQWRQYQPDSSKPGQMPTEIDE